MIEPFDPMLANSGEPFDSDRHLFEIKWDGVRALAAVESDGWRLWGRRRADYAPRYPELELLRCLPPGTIIDGELVVLRDGRADFAGLLRRHQLASLPKLERARRQLPVTYVIFDLPWHGGKSLLQQPFCQRRQVLEDLIERAAHPQLVLSHGVVGPGKAWFEKVVAARHEGIMAKHLKGRYLPGRRSSHWLKIKPRLSLICVIIGYRWNRKGVTSLLLAAECEGCLSYVGQVSCRITDRFQLAELLAGHHRSQPVIPCRRSAQWVEPVLYCRVRFLRWSTSSGHLTGASFDRLLNTIAR